MSAKRTKKFDLGDLYIYFFILNSYDARQPFKKSGGIKIVISKTSIIVEIKRYQQKLIDEFFDIKTKILVNIKKKIK